MLSPPKTLTLTWMKNCPQNICPRKMVLDGHHHGWIFVGFLQIYLKILYVEICLQIITVVMLRKVHFIPICTKSIVLSPIFGDLIKHLWIGNIILEKLMLSLWFLYFKLFTFWRVFDPTMYQRTTVDTFVIFNGER